MCSAISLWFWFGFPSDWWYWASIYVHLTICIFFWRNVYSSSLNIPLFNLVFFFLFYCEVVLVYIVQILDPITYGLHISSTFIGCLSLSWECSLMHTEFYFDEVQFMYFLWPVLLVLFLRIHHQIQGYEDLPSLMSYSKSFMVLAHI